MTTADPTSLLSWINTLSQAGAYGLLIAAIWAFLTKRLTRYSDVEDAKNEGNTRVKEQKDLYEAQLNAANVRADTIDKAWQARYESNNKDWTERDHVRYEELQRWQGHAVRAIEVLQAATTLAADSVSTLRAKATNTDTPTSKL